MKIVIDQDHLSPDKELRFLVRSPGGDITMGFDGYPWHTHGEVLLKLPAESSEAAAEHFVNDLVSGKLIIAISQVADKITDIWITDSPSDDLRHAAADELITFRLWDGTPVLP
jgi:hypothetical protein